MKTTAKCEKSKQHFKKHHCLGKIIDKIFINILSHFSSQYIILKMGCFSFYTDMILSNTVFCDWSLTL